MEVILEYEVPSYVETPDEKDTHRRREDYFAKKNSTGESIVEKIAPTSVFKVTTEDREFLDNVILEYAKGFFEVPSAVYPKSGENLEDLVFPTPETAEIQIEDVPYDMALFVKNKYSNLKLIDVQKNDDGVVTKLSGYHVGHKGVVVLNWDFGDIELTDEDKSDFTTVTVTAESYKLQDNIYVLERIENELNSIHNYFKENPFGDPLLAQSN